MFTASTLIVAPSFAPWGVSCWKIAKGTGTFIKGGGGLVASIFKHGDEVAEVVSHTSVWSSNPFRRGVDIEHAVAAGEYASWYKVGAEDNGYFELVDFQMGDTLVSLKSVDPSSATAVSRMQGHINELATSGAFVGYDPANIANLVLDIRVPAGQGDSLSSLIQYGADSGVTVKIVGFP